MKLKDLLETIDKNTKICICDEMGPHTYVLPWGEIPAICIIDILDREVERIYVDDEDNSLTIELVDIDYSSTNIQ